MRFVPNPNLERELSALAEYRDVLVEKAEDVADAARQVGHRIMPTGRGEQINVEAGAENVYVVNEDDGAAIDEWGSINSIPYAPLRRGTRMTGLELRER